MKQPALLASLAALLLASAGSAQGQDAYNGRNMRYMYTANVIPTQQGFADPAHPYHDPAIQQKLRMMQDAGINTITLDAWTLAEMREKLAVVRADPLLSKFKVVLAFNGFLFPSPLDRYNAACTAGQERLPDGVAEALDALAQLGKDNADIVVGYYTFDEPALESRIRLYPGSSASTMRRICKRYQELVRERIRLTDQDAMARPVIVSNTMSGPDDAQIQQTMSTGAQDVLFLQIYTTQKDVIKGYLQALQRNNLHTIPLVYVTQTFEALVKHPQTEEQDNSKRCLLDPRLSEDFEPQLQQALSEVFGTNKPASRGYAYFAFWPAWRELDKPDFKWAIDNCALHQDSTIEHLQTRPDLKVVAIKTTPAQFTPGTPVQITATIRNAGASATPNGWHGVLVRENGACFASGCAWGGFTGSLGAGQETDVVINGGATWQPGAGLKRLEATVDDQYLIQETRDDNNTFAREIAVGDKADLVTWGLTTTPSSFTPATPVTFSTWVENRGSMSTPNGWLGVLYTVDNACPASGCIWGGVTASLAPGQGMWIHTNSAAPWSATPGSHVIRAVVDDAGQIPEYSESNNVVARDLVVSDKPDLRILSVRTEPALPRAGDAVSFVATVENRGSVALSAPWLGLVAQQNNACFASGCVWGGLQNASLQPGQSVEIRTYNSAWQASPGLHTLQVKVDDSASIPEADESNNMIEVPVFVP